MSIICFVIKGRNLGTENETTLCQTVIQEYIPEKWFNKVAKANDTPQTAWNTIVFVLLPRLKWWNRNHHTVQRIKVLNCVKESINHVV